MTDDNQIAASVAAQLFANPVPPETSYEVDRNGHEGYIQHEQGRAALA